MKVLFVCSGLEPGYDGVGDYARQLARACCERGVGAALLALHDRDVTGDPACNEEGDIPALRLSSTSSWSERLAQARKFATDFGPDWLSLQFVPYGFADRGIVWNLAPRLRELGAGRRWHLMCHEVWIGTERGASARHRAVGFLQRQCVLALFRTLAPSLVTTTNGAYASLLGRRGVSAARLPLFGNVAPLPEPSAEVKRWIDDSLSARLARPSAGQLDDRWFFAFFGSLHEAWQPQPLLSYVREAAARAGKRPCFVSIGRMGAGERLWSSLREEHGSEFGFISLGSQPAESVSGLFHRAHFGVATSPWLLVGKSGTAQAMLEHGLPVIVSRDDLHYREPIVEEQCRPEGLIKMDDSLAERLVAARRGPVGSTLPQVADEFLAHLSRS